MLHFASAIWLLALGTILLPSQYPGQLVLPFPPQASLVVAMISCAIDLALGWDATRQMQERPAKTHLDNLMEAFLMPAMESPVSIRTMNRVGQSRIYTPHMTVYLVISLAKTPYVHPFAYDSGQP